MFEACDLDGSGALEAPELSEMIARLAPRARASRAERRRMLVGTHRAAADDDGKITYAAFLRAARLARLKIVDAKGTEVVLGIEETMRSAEAAEATEDGSSTVASAAEANRARRARYDSRIDAEGSDWTLEAITIGDREFLLDPETRQLFVRASEATARLGPKPRRRRKPSAHRRMRREWAKENAGPASEPTSETESDSDYDFDDSAPSSPEKSDDAETANASPEGWPVLFGRLASNGRVARHRPMLDFFDGAQAFLPVAARPGGETVPDIRRSAAGARRGKTRVAVAERGAVLSNGSRNAPPGRLVGGARLSARDARRGRRRARLRGGVRTRRVGVRAVRRGRRAARVGAIRR